MTDASFFEALHRDGTISDTSFEKIKNSDQTRLLSVHWEIRTILYLGILLFTTGIGILVYKNLDTISHQVVLIFIALVSISGFVYCAKNKLPFSLEKVKAPNAFFDYILLLSCICLLIFIGYWQYEYKVFGDRYGLATAIPMLLLFFCAYFFDHLGTLSMAITNFAAWVGIAVTPARILKDNDFNSTTIIGTGVLLGIALLLAAKLTTIRRIKTHFEFTYTNFGMHILFISCIAGLFYFTSIYPFWFLGLFIICLYFYREAEQSRSFYFLFVLSVYFYIGLSYTVIRFIFYTANADIGGVYLGLLYFIGSGIVLIRFLMHQNKKFRQL